MDELNLLLRCALQKDNNYHNSTESVGHQSNNMTDLHNLTDLKKDLNPNETSVNNLSGLVTVSGFLLMLLVDIAFRHQFIKRSSPAVTDRLSKIFSEKTFSRTLALTILVLAFPVVTTFLILASVYKFACSVIIKWTDKQFVEFLDSFDVFWSLEDDATKSIINVLGVIEADSPINLANNIKEKLRSLLDNEDTEKIFYRRHEKHGFFYWRRYGFIDIDEYVEVVESKRDYLGVKDLENVMGDVQEKSLPYEDKGLFQILITRERIGKSNNERGEYGIVFRIHHSVGDGVALIEFLCQTFADPAEDSPINVFSMPDSCNNSSPTNILDMMSKLCKIPLRFIDGVLRKPDENQLHGKSLTGKKIFKWTNDGNLLAKIKEIKEVKNLNFTDVLLNGLSNGLEMHFKEKQVPVPDNVAAILPVRFSKQLLTKSSTKFKNDFTVTTLDVPVQEPIMEEIKIRCKELRKSADPLMNYYFLKLVTSTLPRHVLYPVLQSVQATLVFSNMPGPGRISICGGNDLKSLVFFVPNKGTTGLGITALCYGGVLRFAAMADAALVSDSEELAIILNGMVEEIHRLHQQCVQ